MKFSPLQGGTSSRPIHETSNSNSSFVNEKNQKEEMTLNSSLDNKK